MYYFGLIVWLSASVLGAKQSQSSPKHAQTSSGKHSALSLSTCSGHAQTCMYREACMCVYAMCLNVCSVLQKYGGLCAAATITH